MGKHTGFREYPRREPASEPVRERVRHWGEFRLPLGEPELGEQGARCMDCGIPFCHTGCPVSNVIPDWNDLVYRDQWRLALRLLHATNNFPEFTGRICPAPCEAACTLAINDEPVAIKTIECAIVDRGWDEGWIEPQIAQRKTGRRVAVVGSGPAGLACAQQLARAGHAVVVFEKSERMGGLLRFGIPDFKLGKHLIDRRIAQMLAEGVEFRPNSHVGRNVAAADLLRRYDALVLAGGAEQPRDLQVPGRELGGVHFAMDFLVQQNRRVAGFEPIAAPLWAQGRRVVVIGGGDTGSDCVGTANRQGARSVTQLEILPRPPLAEDKALTWPDWPLRLRTSSSHEEGCERHWALASVRLRGEGGQVRHLDAAQVEWARDGGAGPRMHIVEGSERSFDADLVLLAMGFAHPVHEGLLSELGVELDARGNVRAEAEDAPDGYRTSVPNVFVAGDMRRGQSLVVWAIREGRRCARAVDRHLMGTTELPD